LIRLSFRYWKNARCPAKLVTNQFTSAEDLEVNSVTEHERHTGNPTQIANRQLDHQIRTLTATTTESTQNIMQQAAAELPTEEGLIVLGRRKPKNSARNIQRQRQALRNDPEIPTTAFFEIPDEIRNMANGENLILGDWTSDDGKDRILLMGIFKFK